LIARCGSNGFSRNPISFCEIEAWARLTGAAPEPWEIELITAMDSAALDEQAKARTK
jgi:hypothetical protein